MSDKATVTIACTIDQARAIVAALDLYTRMYQQVTDALVAVERRKWELDVAEGRLHEAEREYERLRERQRVESPTLWRSGRDGRTASRSGILRYRHLRAKGPTSVVRKAGNGTDLHDMRRAWAAATRQSRHAA